MPLILSLAVQKREKRERKDRKDREGGGERKREERKRKEKGWEGKGGREKGREEREKERGTNKVGFMEQSLNKGAKYICSQAVAGFLQERISTLLFLQQKSRKKTWRCGWVAALSGGLEFGASAPLVLRRRLRLPVSTVETEPHKGWGHPLFCVSNKDPML